MENSPDCFEGALLVYSPSMQEPLVTLLSDFGTRDGYVGAMKGVILSRAPRARVVDLTHDIAPQDVRAGARALRQAVPWFPSGTIHVAVVDPGVGTSRRPLLVRSQGQLLVGPDNGLLSLAAATDAEAWVLDRPELFLDELSATFHGRDVFASVAGHLAAGRLARAPAARAWTSSRVLQEPRPRAGGKRAAAGRGASRRSFRQPHHQRAPGRSAGRLGLGGQPRRPRRSVRSGAATARSRRAAGSPTGGAAASSRSRCATARPPRRSARQRRWASR